MSFLNNLKKVFHLGSGEAKKKRIYNNIRMDTDPTDFWDMIGELGDGAFGKVIIIVAVDSLVSIINFICYNYSRFTRLRIKRLDVWQLLKCVH